MFELSCDTVRNHNSTCSVSILLSGLKTPILDLLLYHLLQSRKIYILVKKDAAVPMKV